MTVKKRNMRERRAGIKEDAVNINTNRHQEILSLLQTTSYMSVERLAELLHISPSSVRRDLQILAAKGLVRRTYGGVSYATPDHFNVPYAMRMKACAAEKKKMAAKAAALIKDGDTVFLPAGSTMMYLAYELIRKKGLTVITNDVHMLHFFADYQIKIICPGGTLDPEDRAALVGCETLRAVSEMRVDLAFFSPQAMDDEGVLFDYYQEQIAVSKRMLQGARRRICLCDSSKIGKVSNFLVCDLSGIDVLVSDIDLHSRYGEKYPQLQIL